MEIKRDRVKKIISLNQTTYINDVLIKFQMDKCKPIRTPGEAGMQLENIKDGEEQLNPQFPYKEAVGCLNYIATNTRPDIAHAVSQVASHFNNPSEKHGSAIKKIFRYLRGTSNYELVFNGKLSFDLIAYSDASFASNLDDRRSYTGIIILLGGTAISWTSKKQHRIAFSTAEAEYKAIAESGQDIIWLRNLLEQLIFKVPHHLKSEKNIKLPPTTLYVDNQIAIKFATENKVSARNKYIDIDCHAIRELIGDNTIVLQYAPSHEQLADMLTKIQSGPLLINMTKAIKLLNNNSNDETYNPNDSSE
jgi:hypothetical protein